MASHCNNDEELSLIAASFKQPIILGFSSYLDTHYEKGEVLISIQNYQIPSLGLSPARDGIKMTLNEWRSFMNVASSISSASAKADKDTVQPQKSYTVADDFTVVHVPDQNVFKSKIIFLKGDVQFSIGVKQLSSMLQMSYMVNLKIKHLQALAGRKTFKRRRIESNNESGSD